MIVSHKHRFIFIKTAKTAGSSIEIALAKICGPDDIITPLSPEEEAFKSDFGYRTAQNYVVPFKNYKRLDWLKLAYYRKRICFFDHFSAHQVKWYLGDKIWESYYKFCFERNPWDKVISWYYWENGNNDYGSIKKFLIDGGGDIRGFDLYSSGGIPMVNSVFQFERIGDGLKEISKRINLEEPIKLSSFKAKGEARKDKRHYREILTKEEADIIANIFAREIKYFGYSY